MINNFKEILKGLAVAGLIGNIVKENATISGAEGGCHAEVGTACAMAAVMAFFLFHILYVKIHLLDEI